MFGKDFQLNTLRKDTMDKARGKGTECPCCSQFVKVYNRTINSTMARQLIHAWHSYGTKRWFHVKHVVMGGSGVGDFPKLEYWGLIEAQAHAPGEDGKKTSGIWRITPTAEDFIHNRLAVDKYAVVYNGDLLELGGGKITVRDALGQHFDYSELLRPAITGGVPVHNHAAPLHDTMTVSER